MRYRKCRHDGRREYLHIAIWTDANGDIPDGMCIHHINGNRLDNRIENMMLLTKHEHALIHLRERSRDKKGRFVK